MWYWCGKHSLARTGLNPYWGSITQHQCLIDTLISCWTYIYRGKATRHCCYSITTSTPLGRHLNKNVDMCFHLFTRAWVRLGSCYLFPSPHVSFSFIKNQLVLIWICLGKPDLDYNSDRNQLTYLKHIYQLSLNFICPAGDSICCIMLITTFSKNSGSPGIHSCFQVAGFTSL